MIEVTNYLATVLSIRNGSTLNTNSETVQSPNESKLTRF